MAGERDDVVVALARGATFQLVRKVRPHFPCFTCIFAGVPIFVQILAEASDLERYDV